MEPRPATFPWLIYALTLVMAMTGLQALPEFDPSRDVPTHRSGWVTWVAPAASATSASGSIDRAAQALTEGAQRLAKWTSGNAQWESGAKKYLDVVGRAQPQAWTRPPAGEALSAAHRLRQNAVLAELAARQYFVLELATAPGSTWTFDKDDEFKLVARGDPRYFRASNGTLVGPLQPADGRVELGIVRQGLFFSSPVTDTTTIDLAGVQEGRPQRIALESAKPPKRKLELTLAHRPFDARTGVRDSPERAELQAVSEGHVASYRGELSFKTLKTARHIQFQPEERFLSMLFVGKSALTDRIWCERSDTGERVGAYSKDAAVLAVSTNAWSSLHCQLYSIAPSETLEYQVLAISSREEPSRELALEFIGSVLDSLRVGDMSLPAPTQVRVVEWLIRALGAKFEEADIKAASSTESKAVVAYLVRLAAPAASAPAGKSEPRP